MSDSARPGDLLFPVDRAVEEVRATFTSEAGKTELKVKFAEERLDEMDSILEDGSLTSTTEDVSEETTQNLSHALDILILHLADIHGAASTTPGVAQAIKIIEERLQSRADSLPEELKIKIHDDRGRIELKTEDGKLKIKVKNGEIEIESEFEDEDRDDDDDGDSSSGDHSALEAEADVFSDVTLVKVELNDDTTTFTTAAKTRVAIVEEILKRFPTLVATDVDAALDFEVENRASRQDDTTTSDDKSGGDN